MRIAIVLAFVLALTACGKKKSPQAPAAEPAGEGAAAPNDADAEKNVNTPDDADDAGSMKSSDPEEGGE